MKKIILLGAIIAAGTIGWYLLKTTYKFTTYQVAGCERMITLIVYSAPFDRGAVLVSGNYHRDAIPTQDYLFLSKLHGFDSYCECVATCENNIIIINFNGYVPQQHSSSSRIIARKVDSVNYYDLRQNSSNTLIKAY